MTLHALYSEKQAAFVCNKNPIFPLMSVARLAVFFEMEEADDFLEKVNLLYDDFQMVRVPEEDFETFAQEII